MIKTILTLILLVASFEVEPATATWVLCAADGATCVFPAASDERTVRYGTPRNHFRKKFTGSAACNGTTFGPGTPTVAVKSCWYSTTNTGTTGSGGIPTITSIAGKPVVGRIDAVSNQIIENVHITTASGPCLVIDGKVGVTVRNVEVGPCGSSSQAIDDWGVFIVNGARSVTIERSVIHSSASNIAIFGGQHPITIDRNLFYNARGPFWAGQNILFRDVVPGSGASSMTCNLMDDRLGSIAQVEDHINVSGGSNTQTNPLVIAYNRIRGELATEQAHESGSGMQTGDLGGTSWMDIHDNTVVLTNGGGISNVGGSNNVIRNNRVYNDGVLLSSYTGWAFTVTSLYACSNITLTNNRGHEKLWAWNHTGEVGGQLNQYPVACSNVVQSGNNFNDTTLNAAIFDEPYTQCN